MYTGDSDKHILRQFFNSDIILPLKIVEIHVVGGSFLLVIYIWDG